jgi:hypothetical protein
MGEAWIRGGRPKTFQEREEELGRGIPKKNGGVDAAFFTPILAQED